MKQTRAERRQTRRQETSEIQWEGFTPRGERVRVQARLAGTLFLSANGHAHGPRLWEVEAKVGKKRVRTCLMGSASEIRRGFAQPAGRLARKGGGA